ncbi:MULTISPECIES: hypothetical protein [Sphingobium]|uniref:hypothetical protein n=1 Tax=Sphingobium TaxID=165695 RepID=UPI0015EC2F3A|nr:MULTISPECIES: hypothetical protein [Sphingobium]MCW2361600.1 hypothetical protein [Sphingobium sp. B10D3B]MCW2401721.1 hypothetical protein [Sphingobium sp. B10D7B]MCW2408700.1 hypothetical protein [Sphingobium xanthum]
MSTFGYDGISTQRVVAVVDGKRKVLAWGDEISEDEIEPFIEAYGHAWVEPVNDRAAEALSHPTYAGRA